MADKLEQEIEEARLEYERECRRAAEEQERERMRAADEQARVQEEAAREECLRLASIKWISFRLPNASPSDYEDVEFVPSESIGWHF